MKKLFFLILISVIFTTNTTKTANAQKTVNFSFDDFEEVIELKGEKLNLKDPLMNPWRIILSDTLLFVRNTGVSPNLDVISLNSGKTISKFCNLGRGPGEVIGPFDTQYIDNEKKCMIEDAAGQKVVFYDLDQILKDAPKKYSKVVHFKDSIMVHRVVKLKDGNFFCNLIGHKDGYMNCLLSPEGELVKFLDKYPKIKFPFNPEEGVNIFGPRLGVSSSLDKIIMPYDYSGLISVYSYTGEKILEFKGPDYEELDLVYRNGSTSLTTRNISTYNFPCANSESFMVPYDGTINKYNESRAFQIFHFGFDGSLLHHFKLDHSVTNIAVDWENQIIYGTNLDLEPCIYKFRF
ncbi:6-bladed beta-propeller [Draconibacterium sediminis]|uniref:6-bladed beta-propeller n=1 Tax=Draconibacterium sediminis TaxID=1544798 RepID=A0A0D8JG30_9BACT|nr:6-bladed beta-propeller [Draconibacterium sediminis]KJF45679.1 hypothetical protein LH29_10170 [Draconibacterium sediminis]